MEALCTVSAGYLTAASYFYLAWISVLLDVTTASVMQGKASSRLLWLIFQTGVLLAQESSPRLLDGYTRLGQIFNTSTGPL